MFSIIYYKINKNKNKVVIFFYDLRSNFISNSEILISKKGINESMFHY